MDSETLLPDRLRLPLTFDAALLQRDLERLTDTQWIKHVARDNYEGEWSIVPLRAAADAKHPLRMIYADMAAEDFADTPMLAPCPYFREAIAAFRCPVRSVRLMRLAPGSVIKEHSDVSLSFEEGFVRLHIPVATNDGVEFFVNGRPVVMTPGSLWYLRLSDPHRAANRGTTDRVHIVLDAKRDAWLEALFAQALRSDPLPPNID
jgi:hypothetical protein